MVWIFCPFEIVNEIEVRRRPKCDVPNPVHPQTRIHNQNHQLCNTKYHIYSSEHIYRISRAWFNSKKCTKPKIFTFISFWQHFPSQLLGCKIPAQLIRRFISRPLSSCLKLFFKYSYFTCRPETTIVLYSSSWLNY